VVDWNSKEENSKVIRDSRRNFRFANIEVIVIKEIDIIEECNSNIEYIIKVIIVVIIIDLKVMVGIIIMEVIIERLEVVIWIQLVNITITKDFVVFDSDYRVEAIEGRSWYCYWLFD
jgi:hypothetical protein